MLTTLASARMPTGDVGGTVSSGSLTEIPKSSAHLDRVASGSPQPIRMDHQSLPRLPPAPSTPSGFATSSTNPDFKIGIWAYSKPSLSTNAFASNSVPKPTTSGTTRIGVAIAVAAAQPTSASTQPMG